jgi:hypothetical protein
MIALQKNIVFRVSQKKKKKQTNKQTNLKFMTHVWGKLCGFVHYNVQYVMFIVANVTLKWQFDFS